MTWRYTLSCIFMFFLLACSDNDVVQIPVEVPAGVTVPEGMVYIPAGEFVMGHAKEPRTLKGKKVLLEAYFIDRYEVTRDQFRKYKPDYGFHPKSGKFPASLVDYFHAEGYCKSQGKRLPKETEWEKAARGIDGRKWPWLIYHDHPNNGFSGFIPEPVDKREKWVSPYGIYGMGHNVWEWTSDWYVYEGMPRTEKETFKVIRGGLSQTHLKIQFTPTYFRNYMRPKERLNFLGLRCASSLRPGQ